MTGREFWESVDEQLKAQGLSITELSMLINQSRNTLFSQRHRLVIPKMDQIRKMEEVLKCRFFESDESFMEYIPYLQAAKEWQLMSVRQILNMPIPQAKEKDGNCLVIKAN